MNENMDFLVEDSALVNIMHHLSYVASPFNREICQAPFPCNSRFPTIDAYKRRGDLYGHLNAYRTWMVLDGVEDKIMWRTFLLISRGTTRAWFTHPEPRSINLFA